jgi:transposase
MNRKPYPSDVSDDEWAFVAPYLTLMKEDAPQRDHSLREVFNGLRRTRRTGAQWRLMPNDLPPWFTVFQQTQRWIRADVFEAMVHDLRALLRVAAGRNPEPSAVVFDSRTLQSTPESGERAGYDGAKRRRGNKTHVAVDTLGNLLALLVTSASEQDREQVGDLAEAVQQVTGEKVEPRKVSCCCRVGGWSSVVSAGRHVFAAWQEITNACRKSSPDCTFWHLRC